MPVSLLVLAAAHALNRLHELNPRSIGVAPTWEPAPGDHVPTLMNRENKPTILLAGHHLQGQRDQAAPDRQASILGRAPPKPEGLGPVASEVWDQIVPELVRLRMVGRLDGPVVELFCTSFERWREHPGGPGYASSTSTVAHAARGLGLGAGARLRVEAPESDRDELERAIFGTD